MITSDDEVGPPSVETGMSYDEIVHQVKIPPPATREGKHSPHSSSLSRSMLHRLPEFVISARFPCSINPSGRVLAALLMLMRCSSGRRNKQRKGAERTDCLLRCPKSFLQSTLRESKGPPALRGFPDNPREENTVHKYKASFFKVTVF